MKNILNSVVQPIYSNTGKCNKVISTANIVTTLLVQSSAGYLSNTEKIDIPTTPQIVPFSRNSNKFIGRTATISGPNLTTQTRSAHTDVKIPNFDAYRRLSNKDPKVRNIDTIDNRRAFTAAITCFGLTGFIYGAKSHMLHYILYFGPSKEVLALASAEIKLDSIPEGKSLQAKWRGKPLFIRHRTESEINSVRSVPLSSLRDPQRDEDRTQRAKWLILIGVCTHLGCIPIPYLGEFNGYYCPCHGSHFDASGRIRMGPAPSNLEVPPYQFLDEVTIKVG